MERIGGFPTDDRKQLIELIQHAKDWAITHGILYPSVDTSRESDSISFSPFSLFPSPIPRDVYIQAKLVQLDFNLLLHRISRDYDFLYNALIGTCEVDEFLGSLFKIYQQIHEEGDYAVGTLALMRLDYMFSTGENGKLDHILVEINTLGCTLGATAALLRDQHRYILGLLGENVSACDLPDNTACINPARALVKAWNMYGQPRAAIMLVADHSDKRILDQRHLEYAIKDINPNITFIRRNMTEIGLNAALNDDRCLLIDGYEIAVVYYRTGFIPEHFPSQIEWRGKLVAEKSRAIKCPSIAYQMAESKKLQQVLSQPGVVERFIDDPEVVKRIRSTFCKQYTLAQGKDGDNAAAMAIMNPEMFVMKPNKEGGSNNLFGKDICDKLSELGNSPHRDAYILMDRIQPITMEGFLIFPNKEATLRTIDQEFGVFGIILSNCDRIILNQEAGHLLRVKYHELNEGIFENGECVLDSPILVNM